ncbi:MAG: hypothetical protein FWE95_02005, partial [Planctomycetaceae bacterium]|nr:hypothetical protein [Planctomycetaceae bacterium]
VRKEKGRLLQKRNEQQGMSKKQTMQGGNGCKKIKTCRTRVRSRTQLAFFLFFRTMGTPWATFKVFASKTIGF